MAVSVEKLERKGEKFSLIKLAILSRAMAASKYILLDDLVNDWADQSGELPLLTLRRVCDSAVCGRFPEKTFVRLSGHLVDVLELHFAMRSHIGLHAPITRDQATKLLEGVIVSKAGIRSFCEHFDVALPSAAHSFKSRALQLIYRPKHLGPPDCPDGAPVAARLEATEWALGKLETLEKLIAALRQHPSRRVTDSEIDAWRRKFEDARSMVEASHDPELRTELGQLEGEWKRLTAIEEPAVEAAPQDSRSPDLPQRRNVGRPPGSGSYVLEDLKLVEEMRADLLSGAYTSHAAAARARVSRAAGGGTEASKIRRLITRYDERYPN